jgi:hypothetical protein
VHPWMTAGEPWRQRAAGIGGDGKTLAAGLLYHARKRRREGRRWRPADGALDAGVRGEGRRRKGRWRTARIGLGWRQRRLIRVWRLETAANRYDRRDPRFRVALDEPTVENL